MCPLSATKVHPSWSMLARYIRPGSIFSISQPRPPLRRGPYPYGPGGYQLDLKFASHRGSRRFPIFRRENNVQTITCEQREREPTVHFILRSFFYRSPVREYDACAVPRGAENNYLSCSIAFKETKSISVNGMLFKLVRTSPAARLISQPRKQALQLDHRVLDRRFR